MRAKFSGNHPDKALYSSNLGVTFSKLGQFDEALKLFKKLLEMRQAIYSDNHPNIVSSLNNMEVILRTLNKKEETIKHFKDASFMQADLNNHSGDSSLKYPLEDFLLGHAPDIHGDSEGY